MIQFKPFTATVRPVVQVVQAGGTYGNAELGQATEVLCDFQPISSHEAFRDFMVELRQPAIILCEVADAAAFTPDAEVSVLGSVYRVEGTPVLYMQGMDCDHAQILLELKQFNLTVGS